MISFDEIWGRIVELEDAEFRLVEYFYIQSIRKYGYSMYYQFSRAEKPIRKSLGRDASKRTWSY